MADGGIHDQLGGGFHRYATDAIWLVPHFEKMLYDNAQLARVYVHAWQETDDTRYRDVARDTLDYMERELTTADGAFAASHDADTDGVEGLTFTWSADEVRSVLGDGAADLVLRAFGVTDAGNWEETNILSRVRSDEELARTMGLDPGEVASRLASARATLHDRRRMRVQPARDDKVLAAWNGLAIAAFADAARAFEWDVEPAWQALASGYRAIAVRAADAVLRGLRDGNGRLGRSWKDGRSTAAGVLEDYADLADGLLALYESTFDERWFVAARELADVILERFADPAGGFFDVADDHEALVTRPKDVQDNAVPAGGSMATPSSCGSPHSPARVATARRPRRRSGRSSSSQPATRQGSRVGSRRSTSCSRPSSKWRSSVPVTTLPPGPCSSRSPGRSGPTRSSRSARRTRRVQFRCSRTDRCARGGQRPMSAARSRVANR